MTRSITEILDSARADAVVLRRAGQPGQAAYIEAMCKERADATEEYTRSVSEPDAALRSGKAARWFRDRFDAWEQEGHAEMRGRVRYYRQIIVPYREDLDSAREAGRQAVARLRASKQERS